MKRLTYKSDSGVGIAIKTIVSNNKINHKNLADIIDKLCYYEELEEQGLLPVFYDITSSQKGIAGNG